MSEIQSKIKSIQNEFGMKTTKMAELMEIRRNAYSMKLNRYEHHRFTQKNFDTFKKNFKKLLDKQKCLLT